MFILVNLVRTGTAKLLSCKHFVRCALKDNDLLFILLHLEYI